MQQNVPFISVVIPAYNEQEYLPLCLRALRDQKYPQDKYKILVVDNNSTDNTASLARKFGAEVISELQQGHVYSLNAGLQNATGDIYAVTDADTVVAPNWLWEIAKSFEDPSLVGITGSVSLNINAPLRKFIFKKLYHLFLDINFALGKPHFAGPNMAMRGSAFKKLKAVDTRYKISGDVEIGMRLGKIGKVRFVKEIQATTSSRRFKTDIFSFGKDFYRYFIAYIYAIWLVRPPAGRLLPVR